MRQTRLTAASALAVATLAAALICSSADFARAQVNDAICTKYQRKFISNEDRARQGLDTTPSLIWSQPGAGNTLTRMLVEYGSGYYTGSVYNDRKLAVYLPGESRCDPGVIAVKAHPLVGFWHRFPGVKIGEIPFTVRYGYCGKHGAELFKKAIIVVRNPINSEWAEYQRESSQSHTQAMALDEFQLRKFRPEILAMASRWSLAVGEQLEHADKDPANSLVIKYEDIVNPETQKQSLERMVSFLNVPIDNTRIDCAVHQNNLRNIHRIKKLTGEEALTKAGVCDQFLVRVAKVMEKAGYGAELKAMEEKCRKQAEAGTLKHVVANSI